MENEKSLTKKCWYCKQDFNETDENPIKTCWYCSKEFNGNFEIKDFEIICPYCKKPQSSVFDEASKAAIIKKSHDGIEKSKDSFNKSHQKDLSDKSSH